ncbi:unnamed protein product, partial [Mesorhabditis belari]|uniref:Glutathione S-transferase n=1 Tax=Mesorhabditis belari TaxID=2138241 RepID=A0AAF3EVH4_9BILA
MLRFRTEHTVKLSKRDDSSMSGVKAPEKDLVILHQFPRSPFVPNLSPFCLKVETFLRIYNIKYQLKESWTSQVDGGQLPFIELNGEKIGESQAVIFKLIKHFKIKENLRPHEAATSRAIDRMLDGSTFYTLMNDKVLNNQAFMSREVTGLRVPAILGKFVASRFANKVKARIMAGVGNLSNEDLMEVMRRDVKALADLLGDRQFLFGSRMTLADCSIFGHLASTYYLPFPQLIQELLDKEHINLRDYVERIRETIYSDIARPERIDIVKAGVEAARRESAENRKEKMTF